MPKKLGLWGLAALLFGMIFTIKSLSISRIIFPEITIDYPNEILLQLPEEKKALLGQKLPVYKALPQRTGENYDQKILDLFDFVPDEVIKDADSKTYRIGDFDKSLKIYNNGCFYYRISRSHYDDIPLTMTDEEILTEGEAYLRAKNLLPENFYAGRKFGGTIQGDDTGSYYKVKTMGFFQEIDGYDMWGRSDVSVGFWEGGIAEVSSVYSNYTFDRRITCKSYEQVVKESKEYTKHGMFEYDTEIIKSKVKTVIFNNVEILYYDAPMDKPENTHIQPCYQFSGTAIDQKGNTSPAYWTIQAVPDEFLD